MTASVAGVTIYDMVTNYFAASVKALLCDSTYTFDKDAHATRADVTGEVVGTGYALGGVEVTGVNVVLDTANNVVKLVANEVDFGTLTITEVAQIVLYFDVDTSDPTADKLIGVHTFAPQALSGENFTYAFYDDDSDPGTKGVIGSFGY